jgi:hypothetical protein
MEPAVERQPSIRVRSGISWGKATAWSAFATLLLFLAVNWDGCWLFRHKPGDILAFVCSFAWLVMFFVLRARWRLLFLIVTVPLTVLLTGFWTSGIAEMNAAAESAAVTALHQMQSSLHGYGGEHAPQGYPEALPTVKLSFPALKYYRFNYVPIRGPRGGILNYLIQAIPTRRACGFHRSFTISDDGRVFWTLEPRAATLSDTFLPE